MFPAPSLLGFHLHPPQFSHPGAATHGSDNKETDRVHEYIAEDNLYKMSSKMSGQTENTFFPSRQATEA